MQILTWYIRNKLHMTLEEMEKVTGISKTTLNDVENGKISPTLDTLEKIANGLQVPISSLYTENFRDYGNILKTRDKQGFINYNKGIKKKGVVTKKSEAEQYRLVIHRMVDQISDLKFLKRIYNLVLYLFLKTPG
ncbi:MAG: helix-turn-helix transcriptional regulator [Enterocloster asparagiformis]|nr:helix-turn-helix transcriptional regulator [Enterocloster asparagiformis]